MKQKLDGCISTFSGIRFNLLNPTPEMVNLDDIVKGLAYKAHFGGQTPEYFSIAQHCLLVCYLMIRRDITDSELLLLGLLHDAAEAYIGDMVKPLKVHLSFFCEVEDRIMKAICDKFNIDFGRMKEVKPFDIMVQDDEYMQFFKNKKSFSYIPPETVSASFRFRVNFFIEKLQKERSLKNAR